MKNIAFITAEIFWPPISGGQKVIYHRIMALSKYYNIYIFAINSNQKLNHQKDKSYSELEEVTKNITVFDRISPSLKNISGLLRLKEIFKWFISGKPRFAQTFQSDKIKKKIVSTILHEKIEIVFLESPYTAELVDIELLNFHDVKTGCVMQNIEHIFFKEVFSYESSKSILQSFFSTIDSFRVKRYEKKVLKSMAGLIGIADWDVDYVKAWIKPNFVSYGPTLLPQGTVCWDEKAHTDCIVFFGPLSFYPNYDGVLWFLRNIFKKYNDLYPNIKLKITGNVNDEIRCELDKYSNIEFTGFLSDEELTNLLINSLFNIVPIRKGAGVKIKLLEAISMNIPTVATVQAAQGIPISGEKPFLVAQDCEEFLNFMVQLTEGQEQRSKLSQQAHQFFLNNYEMHSNVKKWVEIIEKF